MIKIPDFGIIKPTDDQRSFYNELNIRILKIWKNVPAPLHSQLLELFRTHAGYRFGEAFDMFSQYPVPIWSVLYWITRKPHAARVPADDEMDLMLTAHAMIMFLHGLDDHLNDGELKPGHLILLVRSEAWRIMRDCLDRLAGMAAGADDIISGLFTDYYDGVMSDKKTDKLDACTQQSIRQTATAVMVPAVSEMLCAGHDTQVPEIRKSIEQTGVAWRLADDAVDVGKDIAKGARTTVFHILSDEGKKIWNEAAVVKGRKRQQRIRELGHVIDSENVSELIRKAIESALMSAKDHAEQAGLDGLANEFMLMIDHFIQRQ